MSDSVLATLSYVERFAGTTVLIKLGGAALQDSELVERICADLTLIRSVGVSIVLVHGGGPSINEALTLRGIQWEFIDGQRVTTPPMMDVIEGVLCGTVNRRIVRTLNRSGVRAVGFSGVDAATLVCKQADPRLGQVGKIEQVNPAFIQSVLNTQTEDSAGAIPVIAPIGIGHKGEAYNINADWAASRVAQALGIRKLMFLTDQDGIWDAQKKLIPELDAGELETLIETGVVQGGMLAKAQTIVHALRHGVTDVHVLNARRPHGLIDELFTSQGVGTVCKLRSRARAQPQKERFVFKLETRHFLTGEELTPGELAGLIEFAGELKTERKQGQPRRELAGKNLTLLFEKPSLRTRVSFSVAMQELGGTIVECLSVTRKHEEPEDVARVLGGYSHGIMLRTFEHATLERMASKSPIPVINGLSDTHHPCQILADLLTLKQSFSKLAGLKLSYIGDGNNILHSLLLLAPVLGVHLSYSCPANHEPNAFIVRKARKRAQEGGGSITACSTPAEACQGAHAVYTDVWTSMGFEKEGLDNTDADFDGYQLNEELYSQAAPGALIMHCMPMVRGKEITEAMAEHPCSVLFKQSENRLHVQKALLLGLLQK